jgi:hypothetical protein
MTQYPREIDNDTTLPPATGDDRISVNANIGATEAIETELGITPSGVYADVRTRLDILESRINNPLVPAPNVLNPFFISGTGVNIQTGVGDPNVVLALHPPSPGSLYLRQDGYVPEGLYVFYSDGYWVPTGGEEVVSNISALAALPGQEGSSVYVTSVESSWYYVADGSQFVIDNITVEATANGGNTRWVRDDNYSNPVWRTLLSDVYIDSVNGNDENQGIYTSTPATPAPLKTFQELVRRWKTGSVTANATTFEVIIHILNPITAPDSMDLLFTIGDNTAIRILGSNTTVLHSGTATVFAQWIPTGVLSGTVNVQNGQSGITFSTAQTIPSGFQITFASQSGTNYTLASNVINSTSGTLTANYTGTTNAATSATVPGGLPCMIQDSGVSSWASYIGDRIWFSAVNSWAYIMKDHGGGLARITVPQFGDEPNFGGIPNNVFPSSGAAYQVQNPVNVALGAIDLKSELYNGSQFGNQSLNMADMTFIPPDVGGTTYIMWNQNPTVFVSIYQCLLEGFIVMETSVTQTTWINCICQGITRASDQQSNVVGFGWFGGGLWPGPGNTFTLAAVTGQGPGDTGFIDYYTLLQYGWIWCADGANVRSFSCWDVSVNSANGNGDAVLMGLNGHHPFTGTMVIPDRAGVPIFGSGNAGVGLSVSANCSVLWETVPSITGTGGNFRMGASGDARFFNETTGVYSSILSQTWTNLTTAQPTGFGGSVHNVSANAHLVQILF